MQNGVKNIKVMIMLFIFLFTFLVVAIPLFKNLNLGEQKKYRILLLGASVGQAWNLPEWPNRMQCNQYAFEMIRVYDFDKSKALEEILMRPKRKFRLSRTFLKSLLRPPMQKPDAIIFKECAAYFPGNFKKYKLLINKWVTQCKAGGIKPILATVIPVTDEHSKAKLGRLVGILQYNDWIRLYAINSGIYCLDLERYARVNETERLLRVDFTSGDGLHLNAKAYQALDENFEKDLKLLFN